MRIFKGNPSIPAERARLTHLADVSNYAVSTPGLTEQVSAVRLMQADGYKMKQIADTIRKRPGQTERLYYLTRLEPSLIPLIERAPEVQRVAEVIGEGMTKEWLDSEAGHDILNRMWEEYDVDKKVPWPPL